MGSSLNRPFIDTNVLFSGLYSSLAAPRRILDLHSESVITIVICEWVFVELAHAFRNKAPQLIPRLEAWVALRPPEVMQDPAPAALQRTLSLINPADAVILAAALTSHADCLVTGNTRDFTPAVAAASGLRILTPTEYVRSIEPGGAR